MTSELHWILSLDTFQWITFWIFYFDFFYVLFVGSFFQNFLEDLRRKWLQYCQPFSKSVKVNSVWMNFFFQFGWMMFKKKYNTKFLIFRFVHIFYHISSCFLLLSQKNSFHLIQSTSSSCCIFQPACILVQRI